MSRGTFFESWIAPLVMVVGIGVAAAPTCRAEDETAIVLEDAMHLWEQFDLEAAQATFFLVLQNSATTRTEAAQAYAHLATISALLDPDAGSVTREHVAAAVALDPRVLPPRDAPTNVRQLFLRLRQENGRARITFQVERPGEGEPRVVFASVEPVEDGVFQGLLVRCGDFVQTGDPAGFTFALPSEGDIECSAEALAPSGAVWITGRQMILEDAPVEGRRWKLAVGIVAGVVALAGVGIALGLTQQQEAEPDGDAPPFSFSWEGLQ